MGLDAFKKESTSSSSSNSTSKSRKEDNTTDKEVDRDTNLEEKGPYFTGVIDAQRELAVSYTGVCAFPPECRTSMEEITVSIQSKEEYQRLNQKSKELNGNDLATLYERDRKKVEDFIDRFSADEDTNKVETCPVCSSEVHMGETDYAKVFGEIVHVHHTAREVASELKD